MREWEKQKERDREIESDSSGSNPPTPLPCPQFLLELRVSGLSWFFVDRVAWRTSRCYGHHSSGWASEGPSLQGPPRQRKSIEIRTWGRALKAVPAKQENNTENVPSAGVVFCFLKITLWCRHFNFLLNKDAPSGSLYFCGALIVLYPMLSCTWVTRRKGYPWHVPTRFHSLWWKSAARSKKKLLYISLWNTRPTLYYAPGTGLLLDNEEIFYLRSSFIFSFPVIISQDFRCCKLCCMTTRFIQW